MKITKAITLIAVVIFFTSCKEFKFLSFNNEQKPLASVGDRKLYIDDIKSIFTSDMSSEDSIALLRTHTEDWIKRMIKLQEAEVLFIDTQDDIENLINEYRNTLLTSKYNKFITSNIDTTIVDSEISTYYDDNKDKFTLVGPIVKARIVAFPSNYRQQKNIKDLIRSKQDNDSQDLMELAKKNSFKYDEYKNWTYFKDVLQNIPFTNKSFDGFLTQNDFYQVTSDDITYMMYITEYKKTGDYTPREMVKGTIKRSIINKRRSDRIKTIEDSIYKSAMTLGKITVNVDSVFNDNSK